MAIFAKSEAGGREETQGQFMKEQGSSALFLPRVSLISLGVRMSLISLGDRALWHHFLCFLSVK